jgi:alkaline phosphatase
MVRKFLVISAVFTLFTLQGFAAQKRNVIFVVADGGGPALMGFLMQYAKLAPNSPYKGSPANIEKLFNESAIGVMFNTPAKTIVTDSAAAGTQMATGAVTNIGAIGVDAEGRPVESILEKAKKNGMATGLVTDVFVIDATPISHAGHEPSRKNYEQLANALVRTKPDVVLGGGLDYFLSKNLIEDSKYSNIIAKIPYSASLSPKLQTDEVFENLIKSGYQIVFNKKDFQKTKDDKLFGLFAPVYLPFNVETKSTVPTLKEMAEKALKIVSKNDKGFFLLVEAGLLDWAAHNNDQGAVLYELLELDELLGYLHNWARENPGTLLVLTADHDTGGFGFNYRKPKGAEFEEKVSTDYLLIDKTDYVPFANLDIIAAQKKSTFELKKQIEKLPKKNKTAANIQKLIKENMAYELPVEFIEQAEDIDEIINEVGKRLGVVWSTGNHTASPLFVTFFGGGDIKGGVISGADLNKIMINHLYAE